MNELKYTITDFDAAQNQVRVEFADGGWAQIQLRVPLPKTVEELEAIIKEFAAPLEAVEAQVNPDTDLSYINGLIGQERVTERHRLNSQPEAQPEQIDPALEASLAAQEQVEFEIRVADVLKKLGVQVPA